MKTVHSLKEEAINAISSLPESANIDDIMYRLYVIDKVRKGRVAAKEGKTLTTEELRNEIQTW
jgi:predicted transcriptional regulator